jgi:hypothetical protein
VLDKEENEVENPVIRSHPMLHFNENGYIDDDLMLDVPDFVMDNPFNDFEGLDTNVYLDESSILNWMKFKINMI